MTFSAVPPATSERGESRGVPRTRLKAPHARTRFDLVGTGTSSLSTSPVAACRLTLPQLLLLPHGPTTDTPIPRHITSRTAPVHHLDLHRAAFTRTTFLSASRRPPHVPCAPSRHCRLLPATAIRPIRLPFAKLAKSRPLRLLPSTTHFPLHWNDIFHYRSRQRHHGLTCSIGPSSSRATERGQNHATNTVLAPIPAHLTVARAIGGRPRPAGWVCA